MKFCCSSIIRSFHLFQPFYTCSRNGSMCRTETRWRYFQSLSNIHVFRPLSPFFIALDFTRQREGHVPLQLKVDLKWYSSNCSCSALILDQYKGNSTSHPSHHSVVKMNATRGHCYPLWGLRDKVSYKYLPTIQTIFLAFYWLTMKTSIWNISLTLIQPLTNCGMKLSLGHLKGSSKKAATWDRGRCARGNPNCVLVREINNSRSRYFKGGKGSGP